MAGSNGNGSSNGALEKKFRQGLDALGVELSDAVIERQLSFLEILRQKNKKMNLTAIRDREEAIEKHLLDSMALVPVLESLPCTTETGKVVPSTPGHLRGCLLDVGTGGGIPGIPLKCVGEEIRVSLVEAKAKKVRFLKEAIQKLGLKGIKAYHHFLNADCPVDYLGRYDWIVSRAALPIRDFVRTTILYKKEHGALILMKGPNVDEELEESAPLIQRLGISIDKRIDFELPFSKAKRSIIILR